MPTRANELLIKRLKSQTTNATALNTSTHAHGLVSAPNIDDVWCQPQAANDNVGNAPSVSVCAVDGTNVTVKSNGTSVTFTLWIFRNTDDFGRPLNT